MTEPADSGTPTRHAGGGRAPRRTLSDSGDAGRFIPGTMLAGRYRIVGLLGRGGMGEVYRADDLKLAHPVALKLLPESLTHDEASLERLFGEVRLARQVAHPHVCRVYDIAETDGLHFLSMEFVDGEDLASLLRRIGRLPQDKALQIARQLCSGLAAAHERGVLHRDLKPANVMIDGRGRARITDFGLAAAASAEISGAAARAGTPGYLAPEQIAGGTVTPRTDVYALGLVLYELFTGKPAFEASTMADLARRQKESRPSSPSSIVPGLDPATERAILRCLEPSPEARPASPMSVAAALPGGDPLTAALEAGETPSPEMVAEAGGVGALSPTVAWSCLLFVLVSLAIVLATSTRNRLLAVIPPPEPPDSQLTRAREILRGIDPAARPADTTYGYEKDDAVDEAYKTAQGARGPDRTAARMASGQLNTVLFWYRESPVPIIRVSHQVGAVWDDPPHDWPGMAGVVLDQRGRLRELMRIPLERVPEAGTPREASWGPIFQAAGLDLASFTAAPVEAVPPIYADDRSSWIGPGSGTMPGTVRVDGASLGGVPVAFRVLPADAGIPERKMAGEGHILFVAVEMGVLIVALVAGAFLARRNLRAGRGDTRGAFKVAMILLVGRLLVWILQGHHVLAPLAGDDLIVNLAFALYAFGTFWLFYIALEPHLRRFWPRMLSSWARLIEGRWRDPLVGRDILFGCVLGCGIALLPIGIGALSPMLGFTTLPVGVMEDIERQLTALLGLRMLAGNIVWIVRLAILQTMQLLVIMLVLKVLLRRDWLVTIGTALVLIGLVGRDLGRAPFAGFFIMLAILAFILSLQRIGLVTALAARLTVDVTGWYPITSNPSAWYAYGGIFALLLVTALALYGFQRSLAGRPAFGKLLAEV